MRLPVVIIIAYLTHSLFLSSYIIRLAFIAFHHSFALLHKFLKAFHTLIAISSQILILNITLFGFPWKWNPSVCWDDFDRKQVIAKHSVELHSAPIWFWQISMENKALMNPLPKIIFYVYIVSLIKRHQTYNKWKSCYSHKISMRKIEVMHFYSSFMHVPIYLSENWGTVLNNDTHKGGKEAFSHTQKIYLNHICSNIGLKLKIDRIL